MEARVAGHPGPDRAPAPAERSGHRIIDGEHVCQAIAAISPPEAVQAHAKAFTVLGDPTRLTLLLCIKAARSRPCWRSSNGRADPGRLRLVPLNWPGDMLS